MQPFVCVNSPFWHRRGKTEGKFPVVLVCIKLEKDFFCSTYLYQLRQITYSLTCSFFKNSKTAKEFPNDL